jgi:hypothetical protein
MTAVLGTLPFIATLWLLAVLGAAFLEESGAKIAAALRGEAAARGVAERPLRHRPRAQANRAMPGNVEWRAAA